jgi:hypothetical protein
LMDTFHLMKESVFHAENEEPVPCGFQGAIGCVGASWSIFHRYISVKGDRAAKFAQVFSISEI